MRLEGRHIIVTGAGAGIGLGIARTAREAGARVTGFDLKPEAASRLDEIGAGFVRVDVADAEGFAAAIAAAGPLDGLVNNAGITIKVPFDQLSLDQMDKLWAVNQRSVLVGCQAAAQVMGQCGAIVNIASNHARASDPGYEAYAGTKGAIVAMTRAMAWSLGPKGIRVNALCPGLTRTEIVQAAMGNEAVAEHVRGWSADGEVSSVDEIGRAAVFLLSDAAASITGAEIIADRAMSARLGAGEEL